MDAANIRKLLDLSESSFGGDVSLTKAGIKGALMLSGRGHSPQWDEAAVLDLQGASVEEIYDDDGAWPRRLLLSGFVFQQRSRPGSSGGQFLDRSVAWYSEWLGKDPRFSSQPYVQLENLLRAAGRTSAANAIRMQRYARECQTKPLCETFGPIYRYSVGYGHEAWRALYWIALLIGLGFVVARRIPKKTLDDAGISSPLILSAQRLLPLISFGEAYAHFDVTNTKMPKLVRRYFYLHAILGYILAFALATTLAGLISAR
jgi:hypothetical protein